MNTLDPITVPAPPVPGTIDWSRLFPGTHHIKIANYSGYVLQIQIQGGSKKQWLDVQTADVFEVGGVESLNYIPVAAVGAAVAGTLLCTVADQPGEVIPGIYPLHLR